MIHEIFLDLDDVCNTLAMHLLDAATAHAVSPTDYSQYPKGFGFDACGAANHLLGYVRYPTEASFWQHVTRNNWAECPTSEIFPWILEKAARLVGRKHVLIATGPTKSPESLSGKLDWIHRHMPSWMHRQYAITPRKHLFAHPGALLIDDLEDNLRRFAQRGGRGILVPRPWNRLWTDDPFESIEAQLEEFF